MDLKQYRNAVVMYTARLGQVVAERSKLNREIERVTDLIEANANFLPEEERAERLQKMEQLVAGPPGFTDSVRNVLRSRSGDWATAIRVRDWLNAEGYNLSQYSNPLASIHTILRRLAKSDEVFTEVKDGEINYRWKGDLTNPSPIVGIFGRPSKKAILGG